MARLLRNARLKRAVKGPSPAPAVLGPDDLNPAMATAWATRALATEVSVTTAIQVVAGDWAEFRFTSPGRAPNVWPHMTLTQAVN